MAEKKIPVRFDKVLLDECIGDSNAKLIRILAQDKKTVVTDDNKINRSCNLVIECECGTIVIKVFRRCVETGFQCEKCLFQKKGVILYNMDLVHECMKSNEATFIEACDTSGNKLSDLTKINRECIIKFKCICGKLGEEVFRRCYEIYCLCKDCSKTVRMFNVLESKQTDIDDTSSEDIKESYIALLKRINFMTHEEYWKSIEDTGRMQCRKCSNDLILDRFHKKKEYIYSTWSNICYDCKNIKRNQNRQDKILNASLVEFIKDILIVDAKCRSDKYNRKHPENTREFNITTEYIVELWEKQDGKCAYTRRELQYNKIKQDRVSMDRIDSSLGYIKGNIALCTWSANNMKQALSISDFKSIIKDLFKNLENF